MSRNAQQFATARNGHSKNKGMNRPTDLRIYKTKGSWAQMKGADRWTQTDNDRQKQTNRNR